MSKWSERERPHLPIQFRNPQLCNTVLKLHRFIYLQELEYAVTYYLENKNNHVVKLKNGKMENLLPRQNIFPFLTVRHTVNFISLLLLHIFLFQF